MKRILLIDHTETSRDLLARKLASRGYEAIVAADGHEGLLTADTVRPDFIVLELAMPRLDGWECVRRLKSSPTTRQIPVIAIAARSRAADRERALKAGFDEFDTKPVDAERLLQTLDRLSKVTA